MKHFLPILLLGLMAMASCASSRQAATKADTATTDQAAAAYKKRVAATAQTAATLTARLGVTLTSGDRNISCNGQLRMKRNDVIQLSLTLPLIGTEVGRLECTPSEVLIIDRFNKQYVRASYADVSFLAAAGVDFYALQALFWNELYVPGTKDNAASQLGRFSVSQSGGHTLLKLADAPLLEYDFLTLTENAKIDRVSIRPKKLSQSGELVCSYGGFASVGGKLFPSTMKLEVKGAGKDAALSLSLSRINHNADWETRTTPGSKYTRRSADDILRQIMKLGF